MTNYFSEKSLLKPPMERAAFSDRQAYVCAELSKLAYFKFEGGHTLEEILVIAESIIDDPVKFKALEIQIRTMFAGSEAEAVTSREAFKKILQTADFKLVETYSEKGTQAYFCTRVSTKLDGSDKTVAYLVFRGTEPKDFQDIRAEINARLEKVEVDGDEIEFHRGYVGALDQVIKGITESVEKTAHEQLIITGHSLGGALAIVYTRRYATGVNGACYTFGAPPVGGIEIQYGLKTPVYEIINELDIVPNLPNPWLGLMTGLLVRVIRFVVIPITSVGKKLESGNWFGRFEDYIDMMTRYRHPGYKSYLVGAGPDARLIFYLGSYDRVKLWSRMIFKSRFTRFNQLISDHLIDAYIEKIKSHALKRNR